jgi:hypothetical protein
MNESFVKARTIFDGMMEESLARHSECMRSSVIISPSADNNDFERL